jgi:hypothetical protein
VIAAGLDTWRIDLIDVLEEIKVRGYAILRSYASAEAITSLAASIGYAKGADSIGVTTLEGNGDAAWLPAHTESLILGEPVLQCFALGCVEASAVGGATCLYDSRQAAQFLAKTLPEILYRAVDWAVDEALTLVHVWRPGDFLIVNNRFMIHARKPYDGRRVMVRCRYDDPNHKTIQLAGIF